ncbi:iron complex outermembrane receptor protein [Sinobacterium caligoides]|uniref:Iron complex outermembrane receptor protein n=1 Tax=Sinobacterium caligoides TaxID=933926 RepID=A0A3N2DKA7_9GAMM|nr:TonB-dependent siderophore receptor [Sinobacterium caligoides]ROS00236.1 iron complex outermembrane receptor protein [Sinobacterium caligoides]
MQRTKPKFLLSALSSAITAVIAAAPLAHAEQDASYEAIEEVVVTGTLSRYSALKSDTPIMETARSISVETEQQIVDKGALSLADVLTYSAGVNANNYGFSTRSDNVTVRGLEARKYQDSLQALFGNYSSARPDVYTLEQVEVLKGPASVLYGQGSPGGIVNVVSKQPKAEAATEIVAEYGNFDHKELAVDSTGAMSPSGDWLYRVVALTRDSDSQVDYVGEETKVLAPSISWRPSENSDITLLLNYRKTKSDTAIQFLPTEGTFLDSPNGKTIDSSTYLGEPGFNKYDTETKSATLLTRHRLNDVWTFEGTARYSEGSSDYQQAWGSYYPGGGNRYYYYDPRYSTIIGDDTNVTRTFYRADQEVKQGAVDLRFKADFSTGGFDHQLLIGSQYQNVRTSSKGYMLTADKLLIPGKPFMAYGVINVFDPVYGNTVPQSILDDSYIDNGNTKTISSGIYANDQLSIDRWRITAGLRYDEVETKDKTKSNPKQKDDAISGSIGALYQFDNGIAPYASYSQSFDPVIGTSDKSSTGKPLKPQEGEQYELGIKYQPENMPLFITAAYFDTKVTNLTDPLSPAGTIDQQEGESTVSGYELEAQMVLAKDFTLELNATQLETEDQYGERQISVPETQASVWLGYHAQSGQLTGLKAGLGVRYVGDVYGGIFQSISQPDPMVLEVPSVTLADLMLGYEVAQWDFSVNVRNLENKQYYASCLSRGDCYPGQERTVIGRIGYNF